MHAQKSWAGKHPSGHRSWSIAAWEGSNWPEKNCQEKPFTYPRERAGALTQLTPADYTHISAHTFTSTGTMNSGLCSLIRSLGSESAAQRGCKAAGEARWGIPIAKLLPSLCKAQGSGSFLQHWLPHLQQTREMWYTTGVLGTLGEWYDICTWFISEVHKSCALFSLFCTHTYTNTRAPSLTPTSSSRLPDTLGTRAVGDLFAFTVPRRPFQYDGSSKILQAGFSPKKTFGFA